jgi:hypothetical protein
MYGDISFNFYIYDGKGKVYVHEDPRFLGQCTRIVLSVTREVGQFYHMGLNWMKYPGRYNFLEPTYYPFAPEEVLMPPIIVDSLDWPSFQENHPNASGAIIVQDSIDPHYYYWKPCHDNCSDSQLQPRQYTALFQLEVNSAYAELDASILV